MDSPNLGCLIPSFVGQTQFLLAEPATPIVSIPLLVVVVVVVAVAVAVAAVGVVVVVVVLLAVVAVVVMSSAVRLNVQKWSEHGLCLPFWLRNVLRTTTRCAFSTSKCASRHHGVRFFNISTSKSAPVLRCFVHFDFGRCFAPQRGAIIHLSFPQMAPHPPP